MMGITQCPFHSTAPCLFEQDDHFVQLFTFLLSVNFLLFPRVAVFLMSFFGHGGIFIVTCFMQ